MANILSFVKKYGDKTFEEEPFNELDSLVISLLPYIDFDGIVPEKAEDKISIREAGNMFFNKYTARELKYQIQGVRAAYDILFEIKDTKRYSKLKLYNYVYKYDINMQFGAMFCDVSDKLTYIIFEGTDDTVSGWYEDFEMCYKFPNRSDEESIKYINSKIRFTSKRKYILSGHSKGGHLAMCAYMYLKFGKRSKVKKVINYDGPGFIESEYKSSRYKRMKKKLELIVPNNDVIGRLHFISDPTLVVLSIKKGIEAHNALTWEIREKQFIRSSLTKSSDRLKKSMDKWVASMTPEERHVTTDDLFEVFNRCGITSLQEVKRSNLRRIIGILQEANNIDNKTKDKLLALIKIIFEYTKEDFFSKKQL